MKKIISIMMLLVLSLMLIGCEKTEKKSASTWALQYAEEEYLKEYGGYGLFGRSINELYVYPFEISEYDLEKYGKYEYYLFEITFVDDSGISHIYNVCIASNLTTGNFFEYQNDLIKEENIIEIDLEEQPHD